MIPRGTPDGWKIEMTKDKCCPLHSQLSDSVQVDRRPVTWLL